MRSLRSLLELSAFLFVAFVTLLHCRRQGDSPLMREGAASAAASASATASGTSPVYSTRTYEKPNDAELKARLEPLEYAVTQRAATEPPFRNRYFDHHEEGLYVDAASGEPLFSSRDKFDSGTGWPSFTRPVEAGRVVTSSDNSLGITRTEALSKGAGSHLGHIFDDGPPPTGVRYCINSAALRFIPVAELSARGYAEYAALFTGAAPAAVANANGSATNSCTNPMPGDQPGCRTTLETAVLAGGCFWGMEDIIRKIPGVLETEAGYTGGTNTNPTYDDVHTGETGHAEAVRITFDPTQLSYADLLEKWFFRMHDPTTKNRQGNDVGTQYRSAIFYTSEEQKKTAEDIRRRVGESGKWSRPIVTEVVPANAFTRAEEYHQDYLVKHPGGYTCHYLRD